MPPEIPKSQQLVNIAAEILRENTTGNQAMHIDDIVNKAMKTNRNMNLPADVLKRNLSQAMADHVKRKNIKPLFRRNTVPGKKKGWYKLLPAGRSPSPVKIAAPSNVKVSELCIGAGGEFAVASRLCFAGFNVMVPMMDLGVDWVAEKGGQYFDIQVKTSETAKSKTDGSYTTYSFSIRSSIFEKHIRNTWYVFVIRHKNTDLSFVVVSGLILENLRNNQKIKGKESLSIQISVDKSRKNYSLNGEHANSWVNRFDSIK